MNADLEKKVSVYAFISGSVLSTILLTNTENRAFLSGKRELSKNLSENCLWPSGNRGFSDRF